jgi:hypothetical protein
LQVVVVEAVLVVVEVLEVIDLLGMALLHYEDHQ